MAEPASSSTAVLAFMATWFTPTSLFLYLNLIIATLFITSRFTISAKRRDSAASATLSRSPSLLDRVKSVNHFSHYYHYYTEPTYAQVNPPTTLGRPPSLLQRLRSVNFSPYRYYDPDPVQETAGGVTEQPPPPPSLLQRLRSIKLSPYPEPECHVRRANSDTIPCGGEVPAKLPGKMRKSASHKSAFGHFEQDGIMEDDAAELRQRPETEEDEEEGQIDAKADDFIGRFRQQLKLQKLESFMRYKEMLTRAHGTD